MLIISLSCLRFNFLFIVILLFTDSEADYKCGEVDIIVPQIVGGVPTTKGEWPFLAALFEIEKETFFCGGTLISASHVMTAAHCIEFKDTSEKFNAEDVVVLLGAYNITRKIEIGRIQRFVGTIHVHHDWRPYGEKYDADIAILHLTEAVIFTRYIRPVCLPADNDKIINVRGSIAGWGLAENSMPERVARQTFIYALNNSYCYTTDSLVGHISSTRTFCGSDGGEGGSPSRGDSGGGFFFPYGSAWVQHGIVSASRVDANGLTNVSLFSIYTKVNSFTNWIHHIITESGDSVATFYGEISGGTVNAPTTPPAVVKPRWTLITDTENPFPINCHIGGYEKTWAYDGPTYIGRIQFPEELVIGKYSSLGHKKLYIFRDGNGEEAFEQGYEVLCGGRVEWVSISNNMIIDLSNFLQGGYDVNGNSTYVCQATYFQNHLQVFPGSYRSSPGCCSIDVEGDSHCQFDFKLLQLI